MKKNHLQYLIAACVLLITQNVTASVTKSFKTTPIQFLVSTGQTPGPAESKFDGSLTYTPNLWKPGAVQSAVFRVYLSDDVSTNFPPNFDAPMEFAQLMSVKDGSSSVGGLPIEEAVYESIFDPSFGAAAIAIATAAGIESPTALPIASGALYFNLDVTALLNSSNTGSLDFSLIAPDKFPDISPTSNPPAYLLITQAIIDAGSPFAPENPYLVTEDYMYEYAELIVTYLDSDNTAVPLPTLSEWAIMLLMLCVAGVAGMRLKESEFNNT